MWCRMTIKKIYIFSLQILYKANLKDVLFLFYYTSKFKEVASVDTEME